MQGTVQTSVVIDFADFARPGGAHTNDAMPEVTHEIGRYRRNTVSNIFPVTLVDYRKGDDSVEHTSIKVEPSTAQSVYHWEITLQDQTRRHLLVDFRSSSPVFPGWLLDFETEGGMWYKCNYRDVQWPVNDHDSLHVYIHQDSVARFETLLDVLPYVHEEDELERDLIFR
jgi:hypothetical protein